ncbi:MAG: alcohol dehydrogenase catalytic domain-containing protein [Actinomycetota bacterium]
MRAVTWDGRQDVDVSDVPEPRIEAPTDAIVEVTASGLCGSDLHLYRHLIPGLDRGDILGHEATGVVRETGPDVHSVQVGDTVVVPFNVACGTCAMCRQGLESQCQTTQNTEFHRGGSLFGYTEQYGHVPGCQADVIRVPFANHTATPIHAETPAYRAVLLADVLPTAWQGVAYADVSPGMTVAVFGLGPIGQMASRLAARQGASVIGVEPVAERRAMAERHGVTTIDPDTTDDVPAAIVDLTNGLGADRVIDAVGMEAEGSAMDSVLQATKLQPSRVIALRHAIDAVRRGGTISILGVYAGPVQAFPLDQLFDKQVALHMGQANVMRWMADLIPLVEDPADPLDLDDFVTHRLPLESAPYAYDMFQNKRQGAVKVVFEPTPPVTVSA